MDTNTIEGTTALKLKFTKLLSNNQGIIPVAVQNAITSEVILIAYTNEIAFKETIAKRKAIFWSTSKNKLWFKGEESGNTFTIKSIFVNCEQNSLVYKVIPDKGNICHVTENGVAKNCFYREINLETLELEFIS
ncbi:MAG: phosphoribosyl-AMP cyclohydrolase [Defluviitaleaceae bacterium]|nr:phosphoribosyl-AMP cyclohydrolase [Defluviitaleaceae bacterium]